MYEHERSLVQRLKNKPFVLVGVNSDPKERVKTAVETNQLTWPSFWDGGSTGGPIARAWGVHAWPTIYVIDDRGIIRVRDVRGEAMDKAVDELIERAVVTLVENLKNADPEVRGLAVFRIGRYAAPDAKDLISPLLQDAETLVRQRAATGLACLGPSDESQRGLLRTAVSDRNLEVRLAALESLQRDKDTEAGTLAIQAAKDSEATMRRLAVKILASSKTPEALNALTGAVDDSDLETGKLAALSLAEIRSPESISRLKELATAPQKPARVWVAVALHRVGEPGTSDRFRTLLADSDVQIRRQAAAALSDLSGLDALDLYLLAMKDADPQVCRCARDFLSTSDSPKAREALVQYFQREVPGLIAKLSDPNGRMAAYNTLREFGPSAAPFLMEQIESAPEQGRSLLSSVISQMGNEAVIPVAVNKLGQANLDQTLRFAYENVVRGMRGKSREVAMGLVKQPEVSARESGVRLLLNESDEEAIQQLKNAMKDAAPRVRVYAAYRFSREKDIEALAVLSQAAKDPDPLVRSVSISGIANYPEDQVMPILTDLAKNPGKELAPVLVNALGRFRSKEATALIGSLASSTPELRETAMMTFYRQGTADAARALGKMLESEDQQIRSRAQVYLRSMRDPAAKEILQNFEQQKKNAEKPAESPAKP